MRKIDNYRCLTVLQVIHKVPPKNSLQRLKRRYGKDCQHRLKECI